jgi:uncharacterized OB-fold protein
MSHGQTTNQQPETRNPELGTGAAAAARPFRKGLFTFPIPVGAAACLLGSRCRECGTSFFPPRQICPRCMKEGILETVPLSPRGTLYTYTVIRQAPPRYPVPYAVGYVDLPEGVRVFAQLDGWDKRELRLGEAMEVFFTALRKNDREGEMIGYRFRPVHP